MQERVVGFVEWESGLEPVVVRTPSICPECVGSGYCQNRLDCKLVCWFCDGQLDLFMAGPSAGVRS